MPEPAASGHDPAGRAASQGRRPADDAPERVTELKVTGHLMTLDTGSVLHRSSAGARPPTPAAACPACASRCRRARRPAGCGHHQHLPARMAGCTAAATPRWCASPAARRRCWSPSTRRRRQGPTRRPDLQVMRLRGAAAAPAPVRPGAAAVPARRRQAELEMVAHVQARGDVGGAARRLDRRARQQRWIEGFAIAPGEGLSAEDIEYQAVLGRGWLSPWVEGGQFCGSRGMALPILGLKLRLQGAAAAPVGMQLRGDLHRRQHGRPGWRRRGLRSGKPGADGGVPHRAAPSRYPCARARAE